MKKYFLRAGALMLALITVLPVFAACNRDEPAVTTDPVTTEAPETEIVREQFVINSENAEEVDLVRSDKLSDSSVITDLFVQFRKKTETLFGKQFGVKTDFISPDKTVDAEQIEILIGDTTREESIALNEKLKAAGKYAYGVTVTGKKIAVSGSSVYLIFKALNHLIFDLASKDESGNYIIQFTDGYEFIQTAESDYPEPREVIGSGREYAFYTIEKLASIQRKQYFTVVQGGGSDGKYAYVALIDKRTTPETGIIYKYDMETWERVATSDTLPSAHTNDIAYDSKNNRLVISYCSATDGYRGIVTVDADTLEFIEYIYSPTVNRGVCYLPDTNQYIFAVNYEYYLTDENFNTIRTIPDGYPQLTTQGVYCDGDLIYDPRWNSKAEYQIISVNSMSGDFIGAVPLYGIQGEPESIFRDGNSFVMNCGGSMAFFRIALLYKSWWEQ
ncbi:MAG: YncE family protein [Eubacteriales bacterium]